MKAWHSQWICTANKSLKNKTKENKTKQKSIRQLTESGRRPVD